MFTLRGDSRNTTENQRKLRFWSAKTEKWLQRTKRKKQISLKSENKWKHWFGTIIWTATTFDRSLNLHEWENYSSNIVALTPEKRKTIKWFSLEMWHLRTGGSKILKSWFRSRNPDDKCPSAQYATFWFPQRQSQIRDVAVKLWPSGPDFRSVTLLTFQINPNDRFWRQTGIRRLEWKSKPLPKSKMLFCEADKIVVSRVSGQGATIRNPAASIPRLYRINQWIILHVSQPDFPRIL